MAAGFVYILKNDYIPKLVKIGYTERDPRTRAEELSSFTGVPGDWVICKFWKLDNAYSWEQRVFASLAKYRETGEFFNLAPSKAIELVTIFLISNGGILENGLTQAETNDLADAKLRNAEFAKEARQKAVKEEWDKDKNDFFKQAQMLAENRLGKTLAQINAAECDNTDIFEKTFGFLYVFFIPFTAFAFLLKTLFEQIAGSNHTQDREITTNINSFEIERQSLFEERKKIYYELRRNFFSSRNAAYPFDDKDPV